MRKKATFLSLLIITFILGVIVGLILSRCPTKREKKEAKIEEKKYPEEIFPEKVTKEKVKVFVEGRPPTEFFQPPATVYKIEATFPPQPTCVIPEFSPIVLEAPEKYTNKRTVGIVFSPGLPFSCKTEDFEFTCGVNSNRIMIEYLEDGPKVFEVKYRDNKGCEKELLKISFVVDTTPPVTKIIPVGFFDLVTSPSAHFKFEVNEPVRSTLCRIDEGFWMDCSSHTLNLSSLEEGWHVVSAYSIDLAGNEEDIKEYWFRVDARPPVSFLISAPYPVTNSKEATFIFDADEDDVEFECNIDESGWFPCSSPFKLSDVKPGLHTFKLRAIDFLGRIEGTPLVYSWTVVESELKGNIRPFSPPREIKKVRKYRKKEVPEKEETKTEKPESEKKPEGTNTNKQ